MTARGIVFELDDLLSIVELAKVIEGWHTDIAPLEDDGKRHLPLRVWVHLGVYPQRYTHGAEPVLCPECAQGKTVNCAGEALHPDTDNLVACGSLR